MSLAEQLLAHAAELIALDPNRPRQANLRRAVSAAYYALFHLLVESAVTATLGTDRSSATQSLRRAMSRWYGHSSMKSVANWFRRSGKIPQEVSALLGYSSTPPTSIVPADLARVASTLVELQEARHRADYDIGARFTRFDALALVKNAQQAFHLWRGVKASPEARLFLLLALTGASPIQER